MSLSRLYPALLTALKIESRRPAGRPALPSVRQRIIWIEIASFLHRSRPTAASLAGALLRIRVLRKFEEGAGRFRRFEGRVNTLQKMLLPTTQFYDARVLEELP